MVKKGYYDKNGEFVYIPEDANHWEINAFVFIEDEKISHGAALARAAAREEELLNRPSSVIDFAVAVALKINGAYNRFMKIRA